MIDECICINHGVHHRRVYAAAFQTLQNRGLYLITFVHSALAPFRQYALLCIVHVHPGWLNCSQEASLAPCLTAVPRGPLLLMTQSTLSLSGNSATLDFTQGFHSTQDRGSTEDGNGDQDMAQRQAAVVEEVHHLDREDGAEEGRMGQGSRSQGLRKGADICAQEAEPLLPIAISSCFANQWNSRKSEKLTATKRIGRVAAMTSMKKIEKAL